MAEPIIARCWIDQAEADLSAARSAASTPGAASAGIRENHRRYWYQQSYEKGVKAWLILSFEPHTKEEESKFNDILLGSHSPLQKIEGSKLSDFPRISHVLKRQLLSFLKDQLSPGSFATLKKIDDTTPTNKINDVSYRYPFFDRISGHHVAPSDYDGWDAYQGNTLAIESALKSLLQQVNAQFTIGRRGQ